MPGGSNNSVGKGSQWKRTWVVQEAKRRIRTVSEVREHVNGVETI